MAPQVEPKTSIRTDFPTSLDISAEMKRVAARVEARLDTLLPPVEGDRGRVVEAMRYSALGGGKRLRPFLVVETASLFDVPAEAAERAAAAVEMIHCYSLIHDDLPAMADSALRRGRPSAHKAFDEATAILAGDGLLTEAFAVLADPATHVDPAVRCRLIAELAGASGHAGMVGGQMMDILGEGHPLDLEQISAMERLKTGALIRVAARFGGILASGNSDIVDTLDRYGSDLGLAFQIADDLLDAEASAEDLGKPVGQDAALGKATFVSLLGREEARRRAGGLVERAASRLEPFGPRAAALQELAYYVVERKG